MPAGSWTMVSGSQRRMRRLNSRVVRMSLTWDSWTRWGGLGVDDGLEVHPAAGDLVVVDGQVGVELAGGPLVGPARVGVPGAGGPALVHDEGRHVGLGRVGDVAQAAARARHQHGAARQGRGGQGQPGAGGRLREAVGQAELGGARRDGHGDIAGAGLDGAHVVQAAPGGAHLGEDLIEGRVGGHGVIPSSVPVVGRWRDGGAVPRRAGEPDGRRSAGGGAGPGCGARRRGRSGQAARARRAAKRSSDRLVSGLPTALRCPWGTPAQVTTSTSTPAPASWRANASPEARRSSFSQFSM